MNSGIGKRWILIAALIVGIPLVVLIVTLIEPGPQPAEAPKPPAGRTEPAKPLAQSQPAVPEPSQLQGQPATSGAGVVPGAAVPAPAADANAHVSGYAQSPAASGEKALAKVSVGGKDYDLAPNQIGNFQRVYVEPGAKIPVQVSYPQGNPGDAVVVEAEDGGMVVESEKIVHLGKLDDQKNLAFNFQVSDLPGTHRVVLRKGFDTKQLDFWVGPPLPVAENR